MFTRIGLFAYTHAKRILVATAILVLLAGFVGIQAFGKLQSGGFDDPNSPSTKAQNIIDKTLGGQSNVVFLVKADHGTIDSPNVKAEALQLTKQIESDSRLNHVTSYWLTLSPELRSNDKTAALIVAHATDTSTSSANALAKSYAKNDGTLNIRLGGSVPASEDITNQVGKDLGLAEGIAVPVILVLLVLAFGSLVSALLPLIVGLVAIFGTFAELDIIGSLTDTSIYAINLTTALGLALGVDYALFVVSRFREELSKGKAVKEAVIRSSETAGRTILFVAVTVIAVLSTLTLFPLYFLRSFAYAGMGVVVIAALAAIIVLPALLSILGTRIEAGRIPLLKEPGRTEAPRWRTTARFVMRHPITTSLPLLVILAVIASPVRHITFGMPDDRVLPKSAVSRQVGDALRSSFSNNQSAEIDIVVDGRVNPNALAQYARQLSLLGGMSEVISDNMTYVHGKAAMQQPMPVAKTPSVHLLTGYATADDQSSAATALVAKIRSVSVPTNTNVYVGGNTAALVDTQYAIAQRLPAVIVIAVAVMFIILFLFTGSIVQPLRAVILSSVTLAATIGLMVWIFQEGHMQNFLGFTPVPTNIPMTVLLAVIVFGLSMDYEVFVMSRIKEMHDTGADVTESVAHGLARSARIVTTAAVLIAISFLAFGTARISFLQLFGMGSGVAILIDATLMRGILLPAFMRLFGNYAWYAPRFLKRLREPIALKED